MRNFIIVGSGAAGIAAAELLREKDGQASIQVISQDPGGYYSRPGLAYYLAGDVSREMLFPATGAYFKRRNIHLLNAEAIHIDPSRHALHLKGGRILPYDRMLLSPGATAIQAEVSGVELEGVVKLDDLADADQIMRLVRRGGSAVVVGGGITALELVEGLAAQGMRVHYILRGDRYWSNVLDEKESRLVEQRLMKDGIVIHYNSQLLEIMGKKNKVVGVRLQDQSEIPCTIVAIAIGIRPRKELAERSGLETKRGILVGQFMQTSAADIFAAGDAAELILPSHPEGLLESLWSPAQNQGRTAALNMVGLQTPYIRPVPLNVTRLAGLVTTLIGQLGREKDKKRDKDLQAIMRGDSERWREIPEGVMIQDDTQDCHLRLYLGSNHILGALIMGDQSLSRPLQNLIERKADLSEMSALLLEPQAPTTNLIRQFWQRTTLAHAYPVT
jgi:NAD(P)H-nitrite reductase large subunit